MSNEIKWVSVKDKPLYIKIEQPNYEDEEVWGSCSSSSYWESTKEGEGQFLAAVPLSDGKWWIKHCVIEDEIGLCVVGDNDYNELAGYGLEDITHYITITEPKI